MSANIGPRGFVQGNNKLVITTNTFLSTFNPSASKLVRYGITGNSNFTILVDWGDGTSDTYSGNTQHFPNHTYSNDGIYNITLTFPNPELVTAFTIASPTNVNNYAVTSISSFSIFPNLDFLRIEDGFNDVLTSPINLFYNNKLETITVNAINLSQIILPITNTVINLGIKNNNISSINLSNYANLTSMELNGINITNLSLVNNPLLDTIFINSTNITSLSLTNNPLLYSIDISQNSNLVTLTLPSTLNTNISLFNAYNCKLPTSTINEILYRLDTDSTVTGGTTYLYNQTPSAPPSVGPPDGIAAADSLINVKGWDVQTD
jgi:hypothetical protein